MRIGLYGAGQLGTALAWNLHDNGHEVSIYNRSPEKLASFDRDDFRGFSDLFAFVESLPTPRIIWMVIPSTALDGVLEKVLPMLSPGDILLDGSNSHYRSTQWRREKFRPYGVRLIDVGISGGIKSIRHGACLMVGGDIEDVRQVERVLIDMAVEGGYAHLGGPGAGHFAKMVHNGIEYAMMEAIGEGLQLATDAPIQLNLEQLSGVWNAGSMISGTLMELTNGILRREENLDHILPIVDTSGEACFTLQESIERKISIPVIASSLFARYKSKDESNMAEKLVATLRQEFGGHQVYTKENDRK